MCGIKPCKSCDAKVGARKKSNTMARRRYTKKGIIETAKTGLQGYAGFAGANMLVNKVEVLNGNPLFGIGAKVAIAVVLSGMKNPMAKTAAVGAAISAGKSIVEMAVPNLAESIGGINGPWGSFLNTSSVAGGVGQYSERPRIIVQ